MSVQPIPDGYHTITPYLVVQNCAKLIEFVEHAFGGKVIERMKSPEGAIVHAEMRIGDSMVMMADANETHPPQSSMLYLYVPDTDAVYRAAMNAGATSVMEPADQFYGDRNAGVKDAFGITWWIATHVEDVPLDELKRRAEELSQKK